MRLLTPTGLLLVGLVLLVACCAQNARSTLLKKFGSSLRKLFAKSPKPIQYIKYYDEINEYLLKSLPGDESLDENMGAVERWQAQLKLKARPSGHTKVLLQAMDQFLGLRKLQRDDKLCSPLSGRILEANDDSTHDSVERIKRGGLDERARRVDRIVFALAQQHIVTCPPRLAETFHFRYAKLPENTRHQVETFQDKILAAHLIDDGFHSDHFDASQPSQFIERYPIETALFIETQMREYGNHINDLKIVYDTIDAASAASKDIDNAYLHKLSVFDQADVKKLGRLFQSYLVNPCVDYINWLEAAFSPLEFDFDYIDPLKVLPIKNNQANAQLMHAYVNYQACEKLVQDKAILFKDFVKYVNWRVGQFELDD